jgi:hypothetical protein
MQCQTDKLDGMSELALVGLHSILSAPVLLVIGPKAHLANDAKVVKHK